MSWLRQKTVRTALWYVLFCGIALAWAKSHRYGMVVTLRFSAVRALLSDAELEADVVFLGSSCTVRGVVPKAFERRFQQLTREKITALNLATTGEPRHMNYLVLRDYLEHHPPPRYVFLEIGSCDLTETPHRLTSRMMPVDDALLLARERPYRRTNLAPPRGDEEEQPAVARELRPIAVPLGPLADASASFDRALFHLELALESLGRGPEDVIRYVYDGWLGRPNLRQARPQIAQRGWMSRGNHKQRAVRLRAQEISAAEALALPPLHVDLDDPQRFRPARLYAQKIVDLCREHDITLIAVELPGFRAPAISPSQEAFYGARAELLRADHAAYQDPAIWFDLGHFNVDGATGFSRTLAEFAAGLGD